MSRYSDNGGVKTLLPGMEAVEHPEAVEMAAFDALPASVRREIREAAFAFSSIATLDAYRLGMPGFAVAEAIRGADRNLAVQNAQVPAIDYASVPLRLEPRPPRGRRRR